MIRRLETIAFFIATAWAVVMLTAGALSLTVNGAAWLAATF